MCHNVLATAQGAAMLVGRVESSCVHQQSNGGPLKQLCAGGEKSGGEQGGAAWGMRVEQGRDGLVGWTQKRPDSVATVPF